MSKFRKSTELVCVAAMCIIVFVAPSAMAQEPAPEPSIVTEPDDQARRDISAAELAAGSRELCDREYKSRRYRQALAPCESRLEQAVTSGNKKTIAVTRYRVGVILAALNRQQDALDELQRSQQEAIESGASRTALYALNRQGTIHQKMGNPTLAISAYSEALTLTGAAANTPSFVHAQANRGAARFQIGEYSGALDDLESAIQGYEKINHKAGLTSTHINLALVHQALGDYRYAQSEFQQSLDLAKASPSDDLRIAEALHNLGYLAGSREDYSAARDYYLEVLEIYSQDDLGRATTLNNLGATLGELGQYEAAQQQLGDALALARKNKQRAVEGRTLDSIATVQAYQGLRTEALENYQRALIIEQETDDRDGERLTLANIGKQLKERDQITLATIFYKRSVSVTEAIRSDLKSLSGGQQQSYSTSVAETYRELSSLLLQQNRLLEAQRVIDLLKVQEMQDYLGDIRGNEENADGVPSTPAEEEILEKYDELAARAVAIGRELAALNLISEDKLTSAQNDRIDELENLQQQLNDEFIRFIESEEVQEAVDLLQDRIGDEAIRLTALKKIGNKLKKLDHPAVVLYPLILTDRLEIILATPESRPIHRSVSVSRKDLRLKVGEFREALLDPTRDPTGPARQLYDWLIGPFESDLDQLKTEAILYAPDDALRYVPLAAFHDGNDWLIQRFRINNWTSSSAMDLGSSMDSELKIVGGAYTVGDYSFQIADQSFHFAGLPFAGKEMETLKEMFGNTLSFPGTQFVFNDIYRRRANFNVLHLATHAASVIGQPSDSFILFGDGDRKSVQQIKSLDFDLDLAVLSACETAVGDTLSNGVEVLGLGYAMQQSGARSTIASLWSVSDGGTHALMSEFYRQLGDGKSRAEALQKAQQLLIKNDADAIASANRGLALPGPVASRLSHPYYWAPFIIVGSGL